MKHLPVAIGMLVCENVIVEENTKNVTPVNCFRRRGFAVFPSEPITVMVLAFLQDGLGEMPLEVVVQSLDNWDEIRRFGSQIEFLDPLQEFRCLFRLRDFSVPRPGHYQVSLFADGETIAQTQACILGG